MTSSGNENLKKVLVRKGKIRMHAFLHPHDFLHPLYYFLTNNECIYKLVSTLLAMCFVSCCQPQDYPDDKRRLGSDQPTSWAADQLSQDCSCHQMNDDWKLFWDILWISLSFLLNFELFMFKPSITII